MKNSLQNKNTVLPKLKVIKLGVLGTLCLTTLLLSSCGSSGGNSPAPTPNVNSLVSIDAMTTVPVINGSSTKGTLYIHNYGNTVASNLDFGLNNETKLSKVRGLLQKAGLKQLASIGDVTGFELINPEHCRSIPAGGYCAVNFSTPNLTVGNNGNSLVSLKYVLNGTNYTTSQIVNYSYTNLSALSGVNFTGSLNVVGSQGTTRHVVGYIYGGGSVGNKYNNVVLNSSSLLTKISNGFINHSEVSVGEVIPVEFAVSLQNSSSSGTTVVPEYSLLNARQTGSILSLTLNPTQNTVNYLFGLVPILTAPTAESVGISVTNNGNAPDAGGLQATSDNESTLKIVNNCSNTTLQANATNDCTIKFSVATSTPGNAVVTYKDSAGTEVGQQVVYWTNDKPTPAVSLVPNSLQPSFGKDTEQPESAIIFTVTNLGNAPLESIVYTPTNTNSGVATWVSDGGTCGATIGAGASCSIAGHFVGNDDGTGTFYIRALGSYGGKNYSFLSLAVRYTVEAAPNLVITPTDATSLSVLANGIESKTVTYTVTNDGNDTADLDLLNFSITGGAESAYFHESGTCLSSSTLAESATCSYIITLGPIPSTITQNESGTATLTIDYSGGTPLKEDSVAKELTYSIFGNDSILTIGTPTGQNLSGNGTEIDPFKGNATLDPMQIVIPYTNASVNESMVNLNFNTNNLPYGLIVSDTSTCPTGSSVKTLAPGESCNLVLVIDKNLLKNSSSGGATVLDFEEPVATWTTPFGFYKQSGNKVYANYLQPTIAFVLSENNGTFESTVLTMTASNESAANTLHGNVWAVSGWLESIPTNASSNCTVNNSDYSIVCNLKNASTGSVTYIMPNYMQVGESANIPLVFGTNFGEFAYLNPSYTFINYVYTNTMQVLSTLIYGSLYPGASTNVSASIPVAVAQNVDVTFTISDDAYQGTSKTYFANGADNAIASKTATCTISVGQTTCSPSPIMLFGGSGVCSMSGTIKLITSAAGYQDGEAGIPIMCAI